MNPQGQSHQQHETDILMFEKCLTAGRLNKQQQQQKQISDILLSLIVGAEYEHM